MSKVVRLPDETDYSYCEFVVPNTPHCSLVQTVIIAIACSSCNSCFDAPSLRQTLNHNSHGFVVGNQMHYITQ